MLDTGMARNGKKGTIFHFCLPRFSYLESQDNFDGHEILSSNKVSYFLFIVINEFRNFTSEILNMGISNFDFELLLAFRKKEK